jgi:hypothetical protein
MTHYRILEEESGDGSFRWYVQRKGLFGWRGVYSRFDTGYRNYLDALRVFQLYTIPTQTRTIKTTEGI